MAVRFRKTFSDHGAGSRLQQTGLKGLLGLDDSSSLTVRGGCTSRDQYLELTPEIRSCGHIPAFAAMTSLSLGVEPSKNACVQAMRRSGTACAIGVVKKLETNAIVIGLLVVCLRSDGRLVSAR